MVEFDSVLSSGFVFRRDCAQGFSGLEVPIWIRSGKWWRIDERIEENIRESVTIILGTQPGERQMLPEFGCRIHELMFAPATRDIEHGAVPCGDGTGALGTTD